MTTVERYRKIKRPEKKSPCPELDAWLEEGRKLGEKKLAEGRPGTRRRYNEVLTERYGKLRIPKEVREAAEGLLSGLALRIWWVTPNEWLWPREGDKVLSPEQKWRMGEGEDVVDFLLGMSGNFNPGLKKLGID